MNKFDIYKNENIENLLNKLQVDDKPEWGKMNAHQMVEHLIIIFRASRGRYKTELQINPERLPLMQRILNTLRPLPKNFQSPVFSEGLPPLEYDSIDEAKQSLLEEIENFYGYYKNNPESKVLHPVFGELDFEGWKNFHYLHVTHHFSQFGLI